MNKTSDPMHILFTADENYAVRIPVVLKSIETSHPGLKVCVHLITDNLSEEVEEGLKADCSAIGYDFLLYRVPEDLFKDAPVNKHYSKAMYYRMLAADILPSNLERVLYLDPDILVINSLLPLWETDLGDLYYAAASHTEETVIIDNINRIRLDSSTSYFNTGILLINLNQCRKYVKKEDIFSFIQKYDYKLLLPDQDVFNALYGSHTKSVPDEIWNYDVRKYAQYLMRSSGTYNETWVIRNTAILHYCGKTKPWHASFRYRFGNLYRHYHWIYERTR